jgi:hypothetical protein
MKYIIPYHLFEASEQFNIESNPKYTVEEAEIKWNRYKKALQPYYEYFRDSNLGMWHMELSADIDEKQDFIKKYTEEDEDQIMYLLNNEDAHYSFRIYAQRNKISVYMLCNGDMKINGKLLSDGQKRNYIIQKIFNIEYEYPEKSLFNLFNKSKEDGFSVKLEVCSPINGENLLHYLSEKEINCKTVLEYYFPSIFVAFYDETNYGTIQYFIHYCDEVMIKDWWIKVCRYDESYKLADILSNSLICGEKFKKIIGNTDDAVSMSRMGFAD